MQAFLKEKFGESFFLEKVVIVDSKDESVIAPILNAVAQKNPQIYIKSRAKKFDIDTKFKVTISYCSSFKEEVVQTINKAIQDLRQELGSAGISLDYIE